jgi:hypothetical protein
MNTSSVAASPTASTQILLTGSATEFATISGRESGIPSEYVLQQNYPNPFNPSTVIEFALPKRSHVNLELYNLLGERLGAIIDETLSPGYYSVPFNATRVASGVYLYRIQAGDFVETKKMVILK